MAGPFCFEDEDEDEDDVLSVLLHILERQLNNYQARFPGSNRIIRFGTERETEGRN